MAKTRSKNEGSIYKRSYGSWRAQVTIDGKRLSFTASSQAECRSWVRKRLNQIDLGLTYLGTQLTVTEYMLEWLNSAKLNIRQTTYVQYEQINRDYVKPAFGKYGLSELRPDHIQRFYFRCLENGVGVRTVRMIHAVMHRAMNQAVQLGIVARNPVSVVKPPRLQQREMRFYNEAQVQNLLIAATLNEDRYLALWKLAVTTGMRQGELLGLKWKDLNWRRKSLQIRRQLRHKKGGGFLFVKPKSKAGSRTILLGEETVTLMKAHREQVYLERRVAAERWKEYDLVFPSTIGTATQPSKLIKRFKSLILEAGLPEIRFHDLRHTAATLMLNNGIPVIVVSRRLGHSKPSTTLDVYGHLIPSVQEHVAELMDRLTTPIELKISA